MSRCSTPPMSSTSTSRQAVKADSRAAATSWGARHVDHVGLVIAEVGEPGMQTGDRLGVVGVTGPPLRDSGKASGEIGSQDGLVERHPAARAPLGEPVEALRKPVAVENDRVTALGEFQSGSPDRPAEHVVLVCRLGQPRLDRAVHDERPEGICLDVRAQVKGGSYQPAYRRLASTGRSGDDEDRRSHVSTLMSRWPMSCS
jgi:hypothetical protein